jgi:DNA-binding PadR family transcriptional regulator
MTRSSDGKSLTSDGKSLTSDGRSLTPLGIAALALLTERPMHPYEMYQLLLARREDRLLKIRPGTLYHAIDRLAEDRLVEAGGTDREGNRPERTTYDITAAGRWALTRTIADELAVPADEYPRFTLAVSEAHTLPTDQVTAHLRRRVVALRTEVDELRAGHRDATSRGVERPYLIDLEYTWTLLDAEIAWLTDIVADLEAGRLDWPPPHRRAEP